MKKLACLWIILMAMVWSSAQPVGTLLENMQNQFTFAETNSLLYLQRHPGTPQRASGAIPFWRLLESAGLVTSNRIAPGAVNIAHLLDASVSESKRKSGAVGVTAVGDTITFDIGAGGAYLQTNADVGTKTIAFANTPTTSEQYVGHLFQFTPATALTLTWPVARWIGNERTSIAGGDFVVIQQEWNGTELVLTDVTAPLLATDIPSHTHDAIDIISGLFDITRLPVADSGISDGTKLTRSDDARLADARAPTGNAGGQLGGTYPNPDVRGIREGSTGTLLTFGTISDGGLLKRSGSQIISQSSAEAPYTLVTSDATPTTIFTLAINQNTTVTLRAMDVVGGGDTNSASFWRHGLVRRGSGAASLVNTNSVSQIRSDSSMEAGFSVSGNDAILQVKGMAGELMNWSAQVSYASVQHSAPTYYLLLPGSTDRLLLPGSTDKLLLPH